MTPNRLIPIQEVCRQAGMGETKLRAYIAAGKFPRPIRLDSSVRWSEHAVQAWIADRIASAPAARTSSAAALALVAPLSTERLADVGELALCVLAACVVLLVARGLQIIYEALTARPAPRVSALTVADTGVVTTAGPDETLALCDRCECLIQADRLDWSGFTAAGGFIKVCETPCVPQRVSRGAHLQLVGRSR